METADRVVFFAPPEFTFDPWDTRILITYNNTPAYAFVSSGAMFQASPKFTNVRDFTDDNSEALFVLLCIIHLRFDDILNNARPPKRLLVNLARICNKYDCQDVLRPWIGTWMEKEWRTPVLGGGNEWKMHGVEDSKMMILLDRVFNPDGNFKYLARGVRVLYQHTYQPLENFPPEWLLPVDLMQKIMHFRHHTLKSLLEITYKYLSTLESILHRKCNKHNTTLCIPTLLARLKQELSPNLYPPIKIDDANPKSVHDATRIKLESLGKDTSPRVRCLVRLGRDLDGMVRKILDNHWELLWKEIMIVIPEMRDDTGRCRVERITGKWVIDGVDGDDEVAGAGGLDSSRRLGDDLGLYFWEEEI